MRPRIFFAPLIAGLFISFSLSQRALADSRGNIGLLGGVALPSLSSNVFAWGFAGMYRTSPLMAVGPFFFKYGMGLETTSDTGNAIVSSSSLFYGVEADAILKDSLRGFQIGLKLGIAHLSTEVEAWDSVSSISISNTLNKFFLGPKLGYDYPVGRFTVGGELSYIFGIGPYSPKVFSLLLAPKFVF